MKPASSNRAFTLVEMMMTTVLIGVLGFVIYSLLTTNMILGAKNAAINVSHQQSRSAVLRMMQGIHSSVSLPTFSNPGPSPGQFAQVSFQQWSSGPYKIIATAAQGDQQIHIQSSGPIPTTGQRVIIPSPQVEETITSVSGTANDITLTIAKPLPSPGITNPGNAGTIDNNPYGDVVCYVVSPSSFQVTNSDLQMQQNGNAAGKIAGGITSAHPFAGANSNFVDITLAAADSKTSNYNLRQFNVSRDISLSAQVPIKYKMTAFAGDGSTPAPSPTP